MDRYGYKRCGCRDGNGRLLEGRCPKLRRANRSWNPAHGTWYGRIELPAAPDGQRMQLKAGGFRTEGDLNEWLGDAERLLSIPDDGPGGHSERAEILALIRGSRQRKAPLPDFEDLQRRYRRGSAFATGTTGEYLLGWIEGRRAARDISANTLRGYEPHIRRIFLPAFGDVPLDKLRVSHVRVAFAAIDAENARIAEARASDDPAVRKTVAGRRITGPATKQRIRATLRSALSDAASDENGMIAVNVAKMIRLEAAPRAKGRVWTAARVAEWQRQYDASTEGMTRACDRFAAWRSLAARPSPVMVWTPEQIGAFLDAVAEHRLYPLFHLVAFTGLRRGETCGLRWTDTDLDSGRLAVLTELVQLGWAAVESDPKSDASEATVAMDKATVAVLRAWRKAQLAERMALGPPWTDSGRVFTAPDGSALHPATVTREFELAAFRAGLPPIRLHDLRHGAASLAHKAGASMKAIQVMLRHASFAITADTYTSIFEDAAAETAEAMAAIVPRRVPGAGQQR